MTNKAFNRLYNEFNLNCSFRNEDFEKYCHASGIMRKNMYGNWEASSEDMKKARDFWVKSERLWFKDSEEFDFWLDNMPFGGYEKESDGISLLKKFRKNPNFLPEMPDRRT